MFFFWLCKRLVYTKTDQKENKINQTNCYYGVSTSLKLAFKFIAL